MTRNIAFSAMLCGAALMASSSPAQPQDERRPSGDFLNVISNRYITPHLNWGKPAFGKTPRVLILIPRHAAREVVELRQRFAFEDAHVVAFGINALGDDGVYEALVTGTSNVEKSTELAEKLKGHYDAIVLANVNFNVLPPESQFHILEKVKNGAGLLLTYPTPFANPRVLSAPTDEWKKMTALIDTTTLPLASEKTSAAQLVKTYRFGEGRIATLDYPRSDEVRRDAAGVTAHEAYSPRGWKARYENNMALVGRALRWASGADLSVSIAPRWDKTPMAGRTSRLHLETKNTERGIVRLRVRDEWNEVVWQGVAAGSGVQLPAFTAGTYYLDVLFERDGQRADFGVFRFEVASPVGEIAVAADKPSYERGQNVQVKIDLEKPLTRQATLVLHVQELPHRLTWRRETRVLSAGEKSATIVLRDVKLPTIAGAMVAEVRDGKAVLARGESVAYFPRRDMDIFPTMLWDTVQPQRTEFFAEQFLGRLNDPAGLTHPSPVINRTTALANQRLVPYMTRIVLKADEKGRTLSDRWLGLTEEQIKSAEGDGSFYNPIVRNLWKKSIEQRIVGLPPIGPFIYTLGDENSFSYDAGYSPADNAEWPKFLKSRYGTIEKLNREWNAEYSGFEVVPHFTPQQMRERNLYPAWYEHRRFMEKQYADVHHFLAREIRKIDPHARVGAEGSVPAELEQTISQLDFWGPYTNPVEDEVLRSLGADKLRMVWWGYGPTTVNDGLPYPLWRPLVQGVVNGSAWYSSGLESMSLLSADLSFAPYFAGLLPRLDELDSGTGQTLVKTPMKRDGIALLWSHASHSAGFMDDRFYKPNEGALAVMNFCYRNGLGFDYLSSTQMEGGALKDYKIVFLCGAGALSEREVQALEAFAAAGGTVVADLNPGILSEYLRPLERSRLASLFGVPIDGKETFQLKSVAVKSTLRRQQFALASDKTYQSPNLPIFTAREVGRGNAIFLNFSLGMAQNSARNSDEFERFMLNLMQLAQISPKWKANGIERDDVMLRVRANPENEIVGVLAEKPSLGKTLTLSTQRTAWVYEVNKGFVGRVAQWPVNLAIPFRTYAVFSKKPSAPRFSLNTRRLRGGQSVRFSTEKLSPHGIYRLEVFGPDEKEVRPRRQVFTLSTQPRETAFSFDDAPGTYRLRLTDVRTALFSERAVTLRP